MAVPRTFSSLVWSGVSAMLTTMTLAVKSCVGLRSVPVVCASPITDADLEDIARKVNNTPCNVRIECTVLGNDENSGEFRWRLLRESALNGWTR